MRRRRFIVRSWVGSAALALLLFWTDSSSAASGSTKDAARFLDQSSFGATQASIARLKQLGVEAFLTEQLAGPPNNYPALAFWPSSQPSTCVNDNAASPPVTCQRDNYTYYLIQRHFFTNALTGSDQLRQRVAFALSQILVTSESDVPLPAWMRSYQQLLYTNALGNFRELLKGVTLHPSMGRFLDMVNNRCQTRTPHNPAICTSSSNFFAPNENYGREVLQLFSVGTLYKLNPDGTDQTDSSGNPIFTYNQQNITEFARVFTGWVLAANLPPPAGVTDPVPNYQDPMVAVESRHDRGAKTLLNGVTIPEGKTAQEEMEIAMDNLAYHPNTAPFISKQLIQHLVSSNPSPAYVKRVAKVFSDNSHSANQLQLVVKAILLDREARTAPTARRRPNAGKLDEPVLFMTRFLRALNAQSDGVINSFSTIGSAAMAQDVFRAPSVFNYYPPDYEVPGEAGILGPAFGIFNTRTSLNRANFVNRLVFGNIPASQPDRPTGTSIDFSPWTALSTTPANLVAELNCLLAACSLSSAAQATIVNAINTVPVANALRRVQTAVYLVATTGQTSVQR